MRFRFQQTVRSLMQEYLQFFAVMFFFMLFILGAGSAVSSLNMVVKVVLDHFPSAKSWKVALATSCVFFLVGLVYVTPVSNEIQLVTI